MLLTSRAFLLFLPIVLGLFLVVPARMRWLVLLTASVVFYGFWHTPYLFLALGIVTCVSFWVGKHIASLPQSRRRFCWLWVGIFADLAVLIWLRYLPALARLLSDLFRYPGLQRLAAAMPVLVSVGVSFYVFQGISYIIDIYWDRESPEPNIGRFSLYMMFFPKLLQGPIERAGHLLPQLRQTLQTNRECLTIGMHLLVWGFLKKVVVADTIAGYVDSIFGDVHAYPVLSHLAATYAYAIQVYFDFSGYTDMALGAARLFGLRLTQNFNQPYASASIGEFWRRWHISFSRWILDYIFTPLQMQWREWRVWGTSAALLVTFFLSGLWHGPSGGFIVWGLLHGTYLAGSALSARVRSRIRVRLGISNPTKHTLWRIFLTFNLVCLASMFFRAARVKDGIFMLANGITTLPAYLWEVHLGQRSIVGDLLLGRSGAEFASACLLIGFVFVVEWLERRQGGLAGRSSEFRWLRNLPFWAQGAIYGCAFYLVTLRGAAAKSFIYLQF